MLLYIQDIFQLIKIPDQNITWIEWEKKQKTKIAIKFLKDIENLKSATNQQPLIKLIHYKSNGQRNIEWTFESRNKSRKKEKLIVGGKKGWKS